MIATAVAVPPVIAGSLSGQKTTELSALSPFSTVTISDANVGQSESLTVTLSAAANGSLSNLGRGSYNAATGVYSVTGSAAEVTAALQALVFTPAQHQVSPGQAVNTTFTIQDSDTAGQVVTDRTATVIATAVAVPPTITGAVAGQTVNDNGTVHPVANITITDLNAGQIETVTLTLSAAANGILSQLGSGTYNKSTGVYSVSGSAAAVTAALAGLVFTPTAHQVPPGQSVTTTFTIKDSDSAGQSVTDTTTSVVVTAVAVQPTITGSAAGQRTDDSTPIAPFRSITITDANSGQTETVSVTLSDPANGALSSPGSGSYNGATGVYSVTGSAAAVTAALQGLVFTPTAHQVSPGASVTTTFTIRDTDTAGQIASNATSSVTTTALVSPVIESAGNTKLVRVSDQFVMQDSNGNGPPLKISGNAVTNGQLGGWAPIGAERTSTGYLVAFYNANQNLYATWTTDTAGNFITDPTGLVGGTSYALESLEPTFQQDLNGDGHTGAVSTVIESAGSTRLVEFGEQYFLQDSGGSGPSIKFTGIPVTTSQLGGWTLLGAEQTSTGYIAALYNASQHLYATWTTDPAGNFITDPTGLVGGTSYALESLEPTFQQDLNGDGRIGPVSTVIESAGSTSLVQFGEQYFLQIGGSGPSIKFTGIPVTTSQLGGWALLGAEQISTGYIAALYNATLHLYATWTTDSAGNFITDPTGLVSGTSYALESLEPTFRQDLNGDGRIGPVSTVIESTGDTSLVQFGEQYFLQDSGGSGPSIKFSGTPVTTSQLGGWTLLGAERTSSGYIAALYNASQHLYATWTTDTAGNFITDPTGLVSGTSYALESLEPTFQQDLNGDGRIGPVSKVIEPAGNTSLVQFGERYFLQGSGGSGPSINFSGMPVTTGQLGDWSLLGAEQTSGGYLAVLHNAGLGQYATWALDTNGTLIDDPTGWLTGPDFTLEQIETTLGQDLNGDGRLSTVVLTGTNGADSIDLSADPQSATIKLGGNTAGVSSGLSSPSLIFLHAPDTVVLGAGVSTVQYALLPTSGIEEISNFQFGRDVLNIDLSGAASGTLRAFDTTVNGSAAIALASSSDLTHGVVLLNTGAQTASDLLAHHTVFSGGHALIG